MNGELPRRGPLSWMARNPVAANLLMVFLMVGGLIVGSRVKQEVFPEMPPEYISVNVVYPGASPAEVEQGILMAVEEAVRGIEGVEKVSGTAVESAGRVLVEMLFDADRDRVLTDVQTAVARITTLPQDAERAVISMATNRREVISLVLYGDQEPEVLHQYAERARDALLASPRVTQIDVTGVPAREISVEVPQATLRAHGLTLEGIAMAVKQGALELPAGGVKTESGEILVRTNERRDFGSEFADLPVLTTPTGVRLHLGEIAEIRDGYADTDEEAHFNGKRAVLLRVYRVGDQTPVEVADVVKAYAKELRETLPAGMHVETWFDWSDIYRQRMGLLVRNAVLGLILVLVLLGLFIELKLAFWVTLGIPISFLGSLLLLPGLGVSINMLSMFAFIVTLGMVVDDAIIVGENIYHRRQQGMSHIEAAIKGAREVSVPVTFAILTTMTAFSPIMFVPGVVGTIFRVIPFIVISVLGISFVESLFVLPAHLGHDIKPPQRGLARVLYWLVWGLTSPLHFFFWLFERLRRVCSAGMEHVRHGPYRAFLAKCLEYRYLTLALGVAALMLTISLIAGGRIRTSHMPRVDSDRISASVTLPFGSPVEQTREVRDHLIASAREVLARYGTAEEPEQHSKGIYAVLGQLRTRRGHRGGAGAAGGGGHLTGVSVYLLPSDQRPFSARQFSEQWRATAGEIPGLENLIFDYTIGFSPGAAIDIELRHRDLDVLEQASSELAEVISTYANVWDVDDGFSEGKPQLDITIRPHAAALGLSASALGRQARSSFYGVEALRQQRGRDEVRVLVRLPERERSSEHDISSLVVRAPGGGEMLLTEAAEIDRGNAYTSISRNEGRRVVSVTADTDPGRVEDVLSSLREKSLPALVARYPGLSYSFEGEEREREEVWAALKSGFIVALLAIYALLAIPFKSYTQPLVVMSAIPFGLVGAVLGHWALGYDLSNISLMGIVALSGVVVNDSLVLIDANNRYRRRGLSAFDSILNAGVRRFRPIWLTSLPTFGGLTPMIYEPSEQARFLIPMAISLGFGVLFATVIVLVLVPAFSLVIEDIVQIFGGRTSQEAPVDATAPLPE